MDSIVTVVVSSLIGGAVAYAGAVINSRLAMRTHIDQSLREVRIGVYKDLWRKTGLLPQWPKARDVTYAKLADLSLDLQHWYFNEGGIYLSSDARVAYGKVQETISGVLQDGSDGSINHEDYARVRETCSALRTELTKDLLSRTRVLLSS